MFSTWARSTAEFGNRTTTAAPGILSSTTNPRSRSAPSPSAASDPNIIYVASGEGLHRPDLSVGNGIYKSTDAGKTWTHLGLRDGEQIPALAVDPRNPNRIFAAVLGHPYGPNEERGIFRSTDGGQSWQKVIYKDENTGGSDVEIDPSNPDVIYASMWEAREGPGKTATNSTEPAADSSNPPTAETPGTS